MTSLSEILQKAIDENLVNLHTAMPGIIESYDEDTQLANVQPALKRVFNIDQSAVELPIITMVPVLFPRTESSSIHFPVKKGDRVLLIFNERDIDAYVNSGGGFFGAFTSKIVEPESKRRHHLKDAVAILGFFPQKDSFSVNDPNAIEIVNRIGRFSVKETGKFEMTNQVVELVDLISQTIALLEDTLSQMASNKTATMLGPQTILPTDIIAVNLIKTQVTAVKAKIQTLKV